MRLPSHSARCFALLPLLTALVAACSDSDTPTPVATPAASTDAGSDTNTGTDAKADSSADAPSDAATDTPPACANGCLINGVCHANGDVSSSNPCQHCNSSVSKIAWTNNDGATCDDSLFCTTGDTCKAGTCSGTTRDCSNKVACDGVETCDEKTKACLPAASTCSTGTLCDFSTDACVTTCSGCVIDKVCYGEGQLNPLSVCQKCSAANKTAWSANDGASCDDGIYCNGADTCSAGKCSVNTGSRCPDDGLYCTGTESCDEAADKCLTTGNPCTSVGSLCNETADRCDAAGVAVDQRTCNTAGNVVQHDAFGTELLVQDCLEKELRGRCSNGACGCADGYTGSLCSVCLIYVDGTAGDDADNGSTWALGKKTVQAALDAARAQLEKSNIQSCQVWVKAGTYVPTVGSARNKTIALRTNVALYGGFAGTETELAARKPNDNKTILSGDLGTVGDTSDNAFHVVTAADHTTIDGFTITGGNAVGSEDAVSGGGMLNQSLFVTIANCTFANNRAILGGGLDTSGGEARVSNCTFSQNEAELGGGLYILSSSPVLTNTTFINNAAARRGGGIYNSSGSIQLDKAAFFGNSAKQFGGGIANSEASGSITNAVFLGNTADMMGGAIWNGMSSPDITNCTFSTNAGKTGGGAIANLNRSNPTITNCILWGDSSSESASTEIRNEDGSPRITYSDVKGGCTMASACTTDQTGNIDADPLFGDLAGQDLHLKTASPAIDAANGCLSPITDKDGKSRIDIAAVMNTGKGSAIDMGAYEYQGGASDSPAATAEVQACCTKGTAASAHDYWYCANKKNRADGQAFCKASKMSLAVVTSSAENNLVCQLAGPKVSVLLDATDATTEGTWVWSTGETFAYSNWEDGEPNNSNGDEDCVSASGTSGTWNDVACSTAAAFVCEDAK